jgi:hypothetical protein
MLVGNHSTHMSGVPEGLFPDTLQGHETCAVYRLSVWVIVAMRVTWDAYSSQSYLGNMSVHRLQCSAGS